MKGVVEILSALGGVEVFLALQQSESERIRIACLPLITKIITELTARKKVKPMSEFITANTQVRLLKQYPITVTTYNALLALLLGKLNLKVKSSLNGC
jgi:hypothetical protein